MKNNSTFWPIFSDDYIVLSVGQFQRFMAVIKKLGERVEREHDQFLRDSQRIEDRSGMASNGANGAVPTQGIDFESLVGRSNAPTSLLNSTSISIDTADEEVAWEDVWGSLSEPVSICYIMYNLFLITESLVSKPLPQHHRFHHQPHHLP